MKNLFIGLFIILGLGSCASKKEVKLIPLTSTSKEAIENYRKAVFSANQLEYNEENEYFKKAFDLPPITTSSTIFQSPILAL